MTSVLPRVRTSSRTDPATDRLWRRWVLVVTAGELVGFVVPATLGVWSGTAPAGVQLPALVGGGLVEGAVLGAAQASVLRGVLTGFRTARWVGATSVAAGLAWLLGMLPSSTHETWSTWPVWAAVIVGAVLGVVLLLSIGTAQALVLPPGASAAGPAWVGWTAAGWCAGLTVFMVVATPLWHEGQDVVAAGLVGIGAGLLMAVTMAALTGIGMLRLCRSTVPERS